MIKGSVSGLASTPTKMVGRWRQEKNILDTLIAWRTRVQISPCKEKCRQCLWDSSGSHMWLSAAQGIQPLSFSMD